MCTICIDDTLVVTMAGKKFIMPTAFLQVAAVPRPFRNQIINVMYNRMKYLVELFDKLTHPSHFH